MGVLRKTYEFILDNRHAVSFASAAAWLFYWAAGGDMDESISNSLKSENALQEVWQFAKNPVYAISAAGILDLGLRFLRNAYYGGSGKKRQAAHQTSIDSLFELSHSHAQKLELDKSFFYTKQIIDIKRETGIGLSIDNSYAIVLASKARDKSNIAAQINELNFRLVKMEDWGWILDRCKNLVEEHKDSIEIKALAALYLSALPSHFGKEKREFGDEWWADVAKDVAGRIEPEDRIGESKSAVYALKESKFFGSTFVFKLGSSSQDFEAEAANTKTLEAIVANQKKFFAPRILHIASKPLEINGAQSYFYAMAREPGSTLLEKIESAQNCFEDFCNIAGCLAIIHAKMPKQAAFGALPIAKNLYFSKLKNASFGIPAALQKEIMKNYRPIYDSIVAQNFVYNKDAHPENWLIDNSGNITVLDCEKSWLVPQQFDLANLLDYGDYLSYAEKKQIIFEAYLPAYRKETNSLIDEKKFITGYLNSVVHRALSLSSAWSSKDRQSLWTKRKSLIDNAVDAIYNVAKEDPFYYGRYALNYTNLMQSLSELSGHLARS